MPGDDEPVLAAAPAAAEQPTVEPASPMRPVDAPAPAALEKEDGSSNAPTPSTTARVTAEVGALLAKAMVVANNALGEVQGQLEAYDAKFFDGAVGEKARILPPRSRR